MKGIDKLIIFLEDKYNCPSLVGLKDKGLHCTLYEKDKKACLKCWKEAIKMEYKDK